MSEKERENMRERENLIFFYFYFIKFIFFSLTPKKCMKMNFRRSSTGVTREHDDGTDEAGAEEVAHSVLPLHMVIFFSPFPLLKN